MIRTKKRYLVGWQEKGDSRFYIYDYLTRPREINKKVCMDLQDGECVWEDLIVDSIPLEQPVNIYYFDSDDQKWKLDESRNYHMDNCEADRSIII